MGTLNEVFTLRQNHNYSSFYQYFSSNPTQYLASLTVNVDAFHHNLGTSDRYVPLHVKTEVVRAGEGSLTQPALEWSVSSVFPVVPCQFIGPRKSPAATFPGAQVWLFPSVGSQMCFEVGRFDVGFRAAFVRTAVYGDLSLGPPPAWFGRRWGWFT